MHFLFFFFFFFNDSRCPGQLVRMSTNPKKTHNTLLTTCTTIDTSLCLRYVALRELELVTIGENAFSFLVSDLCRHVLKNIYTKQVNMLFYLVA
jgi:hypothetical protein